jgi:hypothetical protein
VSAPDGSHRISTWAELCDHCELLAVEQGQKKKKSAGKSTHKGAAETAKWLLDRVDYSEQVADKGVAEAARQVVNEGAAQTVKQDRPVSFTSTLVLQLVVIKLFATK